MYRECVYATCSGFVDGHPFVPDLDRDDYCRAARKQRCDPNVDGLAGENVPSLVFGYINVESRCKHNTSVFKMERKRERWGGGTEGETPACQRF